MKFINTRYTLLSFPLRTSVSKAVSNGIGGGVLGVLCGSAVYISPFEFIYLISLQARKQWQLVAGSGKNLCTTLPNAAAGCRSFVHYAREPSQTMNKQPNEHIHCPYSIFNFNLFRRRKWNQFMRCKAHMRLRVANFKCSHRFECRPLYDSICSSFKWFSVHALFDVCTIHAQVPMSMPLHCLDLMVCANITIPPVMWLAFDIVDCMTLAASLIRSRVCVCVCGSVPQPLYE